MLRRSVETWLHTCWQSVLVLVYNLSISQFIRILKPLLVYIEQIALISYWSGLFSEECCSPYSTANFGFFELRTFPWSLSKAEVGTFYTFIICEALVWSQQILPLLWLHNKSVLSQPKSVWYFTGVYYIISFEAKKNASFGNWKSPGTQRAVLKIQRNLVTKAFFRSKPTLRLSERITRNWNFVTFKKANNFLNSMVNTIHIKLIAQCAVIYFDTFFLFSLFPAFLNSHF